MRKKLNAFPKWTLLVVGMLLIAAIVVAIHLSRQQQPPESKVAAVVTTSSSVPTDSNIVTFSTDTPEETPPDPHTYQWNGADSDPKLISIPNAGITAYIQKVGVDQDNQIAVPTNIFLAGWYVNSVNPGEKGLSIIDGHVDGTTTGGVFRNLAELQPGDIFTITQGNDNPLNFQVKKIVQVNNDQAANVLFAKDPAISRQLNLITCGGTYLTEQQTYDQRVIVITELIL